MKIKEIYEEYMIPQNLQEHMLRVASLAKVILKNWIGTPVDKNAIVQTCLFHDIAKPINFDLAKQAGFGMSHEEITKLDTLQRRLKENYGNDEHKALVKICENIGCNSSAVKLIANCEWSYIPKLLEMNDVESLIPIYCDMRIGPRGILSLKERIEDLKTRGGSGKHEEEGIIVENLISKNTSIDLNSINDSEINSFFNELLNLEISLVS